MTNTCAVADCTNSNRIKKIRGSTLSYHRFPKDEQLYKIWAQKCKRGEKGIDFHNKFICSDHFVETDFEVGYDYRAKLTGNPVRRRLKARAIPSVFKERKKGIVNEQRKERLHKRAAKKEVAAILESGGKPSIKFMQVLLI